MKLYRVAILSLSLLLVACASTTPPARPQAQSAAPESTRPSAAMQRFMERAEYALRSDDVGFLARNLLVRELMEPLLDERMRREVDVDGQMLVRLAERVVQGLLQDSGVGDWTLLRALPRDDGVMAVYRGVDDESSLYYLGLHLVERPQGVRIVNLHNYSAGNDVAALFKFVAFASPGRDTLAMDETQRRDARLLQQMVRAKQMGYYDVALSIAEQLSPELAREPAILVWRLQMAQELGDAAYERVAGEVLPYLRDQPERALLFHYYHMLRGDYAAAHASIDQFASVMGNDAALLTWRAMIELAAGRPDGALDYVTGAVRMEPEFETPYWTLLDTLVALGQFEDAVLTLDVLEQEFQYRFLATDFDEVEGYGAFIGSDPFRRWAEGR